MDPAPRAFFLYRDAPLRRQALSLPPGAAERYSLYGLDQITGAGFDVGHSLEPEIRPGRAARRAAAILDRTVRAAGGYSGDWVGVLASRRRIRDADVVFSTVDTVGIPLALLAGAGAVRTPIVYASIGLPERLAQLRTGVARRLFRRSFRRLHTVVAYGHEEVLAVRAWLGEGGPNVVFVPFGVDTDAFRPAPDRQVDTDVVSIGADPRRDFELVIRLAQRLPDRTFRIVASAENLCSVAGAPANVVVETNVPFALIPDYLHRARLVVLPVRDNSYSGATTTLLQAMATAKPVVVTRTAAIAQGYHLDDGANCTLVPPADLETLEHAVLEHLGDPAWSEAIGARARETVERHLDWTTYTGAIRDLLATAARTPRST